MQIEKKWISRRLRDVLSLDAMEATKMRDIALKTEGIVRLTSGEPDFVTPDHIIEAAKKALDESKTFYTPTNGIPEFRNAVAEKIHSESKAEIDPDSEVIATPGAIEGIFLTIIGTINQGDEVLIPDPGYVGYPSCVKLAGGIPVSIPLKANEGFRINPSEIEKRITSSSKMIILNSPGNPTGSVINHDDVKEIAEIAQNHDLIVLSDDAYEKIIYDGAKHHSILSVPDMKDRTIVVGSFSKTYAMTGWRIGYLVGSRDLVQALTKIQSSIVLCTNAVVQSAAVAALKGSQNCVDEMVNEYDERRRYIVRRLNKIAGISCPMPRGAFYVFPNVREYGLDSLKLTELLIRKAKVAVYPGMSYGRQGEGHIRLSYASSLDNIKTALDRLEETLERTIGA